MSNLDQEIYNTAIAEGFSPSASKLIVAQARLESADYSSNVFKNNNNMFGMKYVGQSLASRGTLAPANERKCGGNCDSDYYAKYQQPSDSAKDVIQRLYKKTRNGIGFEQLKDVKDADEYATKLKTRNYFGFNSIDTPEGKKEASNYANLLRYKLLKIKVLEFYNNNKKVVNYSAIGIGLVLATWVAYYFYKKNK